MKTHEIKLAIEFCDDVLSGRKSFELRYNDRGYQAGDRVKFKPVNGSLSTFHEVAYKTYEITYVINGWGLKEGYVAFGIKPIEEPQEENKAKESTQEFAVPRSAASDKAFEEFVENARRCANCR